MADDSWRLKVVAGNGNMELALKICESLDIELSRSIVTKFSDGEIQVEIVDNVRGADVFVVQPGSPPNVNDNLMELLTLIDALKRASAQRVTAVLPYYCYARQDRKSKPRVPITARLIADLITAAGAHRVLTMDLHAGQIQGFFNIPVDNLYASPVLLPYIRSNFKNGLVIVSPDAGGVPRARAYAEALHAGLALIDKRRSGPNQAEAMNLIGEVDGRVAIILDDMADTAGTLCQGVSLLLNKGAKEVHAAVTHAVLSGPAIRRIENSDIKSLVVTDTIAAREDAKNCEKVKWVGTSSLFSQAIRNTHMRSSISELFEILH